MKLAIALCLLSTLLAVQGLLSVNIIYYFIVTELCVLLAEADARFGPFFSSGYEVNHLNRRYGHSGYGHHSSYGHHHGYGHHQSYGHHGYGHHYGGHRAYQYGHSYGFLAGLGHGYGGSYRGHHGHFG